MGSISTHLNICTPTDVQFCAKYRAPICGSFQASRQCASTKLVYRIMKLLGDLRTPQTRLACECYLLGPLEDVEDQPAGKGGGQRPLHEAALADHDGQQLSEFMFRG